MRPIEIGHSILHDTFIDTLGKGSINESGWNVQGLLF